MSIELTYRTEDGEVFNTFEEAERHQGNLELWTKVQEEFGSYGEVKVSYLCDFLDLLTFIEENKQ